MYVMVAFLAFNLAGPYRAGCVGGKEREVAVGRLARAEWWTLGPRDIERVWPEKLAWDDCGAEHAVCRRLAAAAGSDCPVGFYFVEHGSGSLSLASFVVTIGTTDRATAGTKADQLWKLTPIPKDQCPTPAGGWSAEEVYRRCAWDTDRHSALAHVRIDGFAWGYVVQLVLSRKERH
jgi:hypothetical protein